MKKELQYLVICEMLNDAAKENIFSLDEENGNIFFNVEIDGENIKIPADEMIELLKNFINIF